MACAGDVPTLETLAAVSILREHLPGLNIRVVNVVDLMKLQSQSEHPHGLSDTDFDALFTTDKPVIFAYHGYPTLIHRLTYRRANHGNFHVHGYKEEGTITTAFDMTVLNDMDRFHLVCDVIDLSASHTSAGDLPQSSSFRTSSSSISITSASMARTCRRSGIGSGAQRSDRRAKYALAFFGSTRRWPGPRQHAGRTDIPLNEQGEQDSRRLSERLGEVKFSRVFTSPLQRARRTCELAGLGGVAEIEPDLTEWDYGDYEGELSLDTRKKQPEWNLFRDGGPRGESPAQVSERADRLIGRLRTLEGNIAVFSHGQFLRVVAARWIGLPVGQAQHFVLDTTSVSILGYEHDLTKSSLSSCEPSQRYFRLQHCSGDKGRRKKQTIKSTSVRERF